MLVVIVLRQPGVRRARECERGSGSMLIKGRGLSGRTLAAGGLVLLVALLTVLGGCTWLQELLNPNKAPVAVISASPVSGEAPLEVTFDASESYDADGDEISYEWDFGDGSPAAEGRAVQYIFAHPGSYSVRLAIIDDEGKAGTTYATITAVRISEIKTDPAGVATFTYGGEKFDAPR